MINSLKTVLSRNITNARGWKTKRKIVVIESDDWGAIRMPNLKVKKNYEDIGYSLNNNPYCSYDTLANLVDLNKLFQSVRKFKDQNGNHPIVTFNTVMCNPNFENIRHSQFSKYSYESFIDTLKRYYPNDNVFQLWQQGINEKLIKPQYHGREHVNVPLWLEELKNNNKPLVDAFNMNFWGIPQGIYKPESLNIQASYDSDKKDNIIFYQNSIKEGLKYFEDLFGYKSISFIANNYTWSSQLDSTLKETGIEGFQGMKYQKIPISENGIRNKKEVYTGKINKFGQIYLVRNCAFEPSQFRSNFNNVDRCLRDIQQAFFFKKPAIITSHRLNFIGGLKKANRDENLKQFEYLLKAITKKWPTVEFLSSDELVTIIKNENN